METYENETTEATLSMRWGDYDTDSDDEVVRIQLQDEASGDESFDPYGDDSIDISDSDDGDHDGDDDDESDSDTLDDDDPGPAWLPMRWADYDTDSDDEVVRIQHQDEASDNESINRNDDDSILRLAPRLFPRWGDLSDSDDDDDDDDDDDESDSDSSLDDDDDPVRLLMRWAVNDADYDHEAAPIQREVEQLSRRIEESFARIQERSRRIEEAFAGIARVARGMLPYHEFMVPPVRDTERSDYHSSVPGLAANNTSDEDDDDTGSRMSQILSQNKTKKFHLFPLLPDELKVLVLSFVAQLPYETACKKPTVTHVLPLVSKEFNALCRSNYFWFLNLERMVLKDPPFWKDGLLKLHQCDASAPEFIEKVHHGLKNPGYERLYRMVLDAQLRFTGPVWRIKDVVRLGEKFRTHFSELEKRRLVQRVMDGFQTKAGGVVVIQNGQFPTFVCAHMAPFAVSTPACLVEIRQCEPISDGSVIVSLMPVAHVWMERLWYTHEEGFDGIRFAQCMRMDHESSHQLTEDYAEVHQTGFSNPVNAKYRRDRNGNIDKAVRSGLDILSLLDS